MNTKEIINTFSHIENLIFPEEALQAAIDQQEEIIPVLLDNIRITPAQLDEIYTECEASSDTANFSWIFSQYLLAQFRCQEAFQLIVDFFTHKDQQLVDEVAGEYITESLPAILASTFDGNVDLLFDAMQNPTNSVYIKDAFMQAAVILYFYKKLENNDTISRFQKLLQHYLKNDSDEMVTFWASTAAYLVDPALKEEIKKLFEQDIIDTSFITLSDIEENYESPARQGDPFFSTIDDCGALLREWAWFTSSADTLLSPEQDFFGFSESEFDAITRSIEEEPKVGRNDPCPCGSGKKYKKCCM